MTKLKGKDMEKWMKCYVGTNSLRGSKGIYTLEINTQNGEMREASTVEADDSAYLYVSEKRKCLYAVMESLEYKGVPGGGVAAYRIEDNKLSFLNSRYAYGGWPCHVIADEEKDSLLVSVFRNGLLVVYGINQDGSIGGKTSRASPGTKWKDVSYSCIHAYTGWKIYCGCGLWS